MKKLPKIAVTVIATAVAATASISMTACAPKHVHNWSDWNRTDTEHWRVCIDCDKEDHGDHPTDSRCPTCGAHFKALAFGYTQGGDAAHADFAREANVWFPQKGNELCFTYEYASDFSHSTSSDFSMMNEETLANYDLIILLNDHPNSEASREAFKNYMDNGGACVIFHAAGFAMWATETQPDPFKAPTEWDDWFSNTLLRSGVYGYCDRDPEEPIQGTYWNTWPPTSEPMKIETYNHFVTKGLKGLELEDDTFMSAPCEWYEWHNNLFEDDETTVLVSMNPTPEDPAGNDTRGPDYEHQIWQYGHHAIAWANSNYNMIYMNWGHNLQPYNLSEGADRGQSSTFESEVQNQITLNAMFGVVINSSK